MTAQAGEKLIYKGNNYSMGSLPLEPYLESLANKPSFKAPASYLWRGYVGSWELRDDQLFLIGIEIFDPEPKDLGIEYLFHGKTEVFADWFTGEVRLVSGKRLHYVHGGFGSIFEEDIFLTFYKGVLINERVEDNRNKPAPKPSFDWPGRDGDEM